MNGAAPVPASSPNASALLSRGKKVLSRLVAQVKTLSPSEKTLCVWLVEHDELHVSSRHVADAVGMDVRVTWTDRTKKLVRLPFIQQWETHPFWFRAQFGDYCWRYFTSGTTTRRTNPLVWVGTCVEMRQAYRDRDARCLQ